MSEVPELAPAVLRLLDAGAFPSTVEAVRSGRLGQRSGPATIGAVASGRPGVTTTLQGLQRLWGARYSATDGPGFADILEAVAEGARVERNFHPTTEVVWTGPKVEGSYLRATRQVVQDIINGAHEELLVVGYWIAGHGDQEGIIRDVIGLMANAAARGVSVAVVLDSGEKTYGKNVTIRATPSVQASERDSGCRLSEAYEAGEADESANASAVDGVGGGVRACRADAA